MTKRQKRKAHVFRKHGKNNTGCHLQVEDQSPIRLKKRRTGKYWSYGSGVQPDNETEIRLDVDQYVTTPSELTNIPLMSYEKALTHPVCMKKLVTVVNLLLLAYNYKDNRLYHEAGMAFGAQLNYTM